MSSFDDAQAAAHVAIRAAAGRTVTYARGDDLVAVTAVPGEIGSELANDDGVITVVHHRHFQILASDLVLAGVEVTPLPGDIITDTVAGDAKQFQVVPLAGTQCFHYSDANRADLTIYTKEIAA